MEHPKDGHPIIYPRSRVRIEYQGYQWYLRAFLALTLLTLCFLIAGLTLGVCGLDSTWLQMRGVTGTAKQRNQVRVVAKMKKNASWMLCSMIMCSVACSEYFPFVIQDLCGPVEDWVPVLLSTLLLAVFAEIFPQWLIPQHAISWGYYCWPIIWGCMWITAIVSFPLAWLLDSLGAGRRDVLDVFTNKQLGVMIKYHERSERRGGELSSDGTRIILGVLNNDDRKIGGDISRIPEPSCGDSDKDLENAEPVTPRGLIVKWLSVKTVDINEIVDKTFIEKVRDWAYSRIPVVGKPQTESDGNTTTTASSDWEGTQIFGFLHVKNLVGLDLNIPLFVKDLPLYPMPIVRNDMSVFELLYMFQLGMSRIAIVVPASKSSLPGMTLKYGARWTGTERTKAKIEARIRVGKDRSSWTADYLAAAQFSEERSGLRGRRIQGIRSPKPIGIITFEDIVDSLLQRTSRDEKDFFEHYASSPPKKSFKVSDIEPAVFSSTHTVVEKQVDIPVPVVLKPKNLNTGTLRRRKSSWVHGVDGAADHSQEDDADFKVFKLQSDEAPSGSQSQAAETNVDSRLRKGSSSYTQNSKGGFHNTNDSSILVNLALPTEAVSYMTMTSSLNSYSHSPFESLTLPSRKPNSILSSRGRHFSAGPRMNSVSPIFRENLSSLQGGDDGAGLIMPLPSTEIREFRAQTPDKDKVTIEVAKPIMHVLQESAGDAISLSYWGGAASDEDAQIYDADETSILEDKEAVCDNIVKTGYNAESRGVDRTITADEVPIQTKISTEVYDGFPPELLDLNKENACPDYSSRTMPRLLGLIDEVSLNHSDSSRETYNREQTFHDDRAMLPSQKRTLSEGVFNRGSRSTSMWL